MRRDFGSEVMRLIDRPMTDLVILQIYAATANALMPRLVNGHQYGEPRFELRGCKLLRANAGGELSLVLFGIYRPRGHLGDPTPADNKATAAIQLVS